MNSRSGVFSSLPLGDLFRFQDLWSMTKPTITLLVVITTIPSLFLASTDFPTLELIMLAVCGTALASASAAIFNQVLEVNIDDRMRRTKARALPQGRVNKGVAVFWGVVIGLSGLWLLYLTGSAVPCVVALAGHFFYVVVYTLYLKPRTIQNIVIGGAAGSVGPLIGWSAVSGELPALAWAMSAVIFLWTPPHFWALALQYKNDYAQAGIPMYPVVKGDRATRKAIFLYCLPLVALTYYPLLVGAVGLPYALISSLLNIKILVSAWRLYSSNDNKHAMPLFLFSCVYVFVLFITLACERAWILLYLGNTHA